MNLQKLLLLKQLSNNQYAKRDPFFFFEELKNFDSILIIMGNFDMESFFITILLQEKIDLSVENSFKGATKLYSTHYSCVLLSA